MRLPLRSVLATAAVLAVVVAVVGALLGPTNTWGWLTLLPALVLGAASAATGWVLLGVPRLTRTGVVWAAGALLLLVAAVGGGGWLPAALADRLGLVAVFTVLPMAVVSYPRQLPTLHRVVVLPVLVGAGLVVVVVGRDPAARWVLELVVSLVVTASVWWRFEQGVAERHPGPDRDALRWLALGLALSVLIVIPAVFAATDGPLLAALVVSVLLVPAAAVVGAHPSDRVEIRTVAARAGGLLLALLVGFALFAGLVAGLGSLGLSMSLGVLGLVAVAVAAVFEPVRRLVDQAVERLLFGDQLDPVGAASRFAAELSAVDDPVAALRELRSVLNLPYAEVRDVHGRTLVASGEPGRPGSFGLPLTAAGVQVGELRLGLRPGESGPNHRDRPVLRIIAPALAQALRSRALAAEVTASRERVVTAVEEDRRRLRRDLHDGLGPTLTGVAYATDAARNLTRSDPAAAEELLAGARADTGRAIAEVRDLVDGLRPAVLDQVGLGPALRQRAAQLRGRDGQRIEVVVDIADDLPVLSAAMEVAVFRIVTEALTNVARHAVSATARVELEVADGALVLVVADRGPGASAGQTADPVPTWTPGVGLQSMAERVDQLGGTLVTGVKGSGGRVSATLPLPAAAPQQTRVPGIS